MRTYLLLVATALVATNSGAQTPLTVDTDFRFYYTPELMEYWSEHFAGGNGMWQPIVSDLLFRDNGDILATGNDLLKRLDEMPWGGAVSVIFQPNSDGSLVEYLSTCGGYVIEIPSSNQYFSLNHRRNYDCTGDQSFGEPDIYIAQRSLTGWHIFADRSGLCSGYFRINQTDPLGYVLLRVDEWGEWDSTWTPRSGYHPAGANGKQLVKLSNGQFLFSGKWTEYEGRACSSIIRIDEQGVQDTSFTAPTSLSEMFVVHEQTDGKVILGGQFLMYDYPDTLNVIRLNTDGTLDLSFNNFNHVRMGFGSGSAMGAGIRVVEPLDDHRLVIGGWFDRIDDAQRGCIACIDTAGNLLDCWANGGLQPMNYTDSGWPNMGLQGFRRLPNGETYICGMYKGFTDANGYHPEQVCVSRMYMPDVGVEEVSIPLNALRVWPNPGDAVLHVEKPGGQPFAMEVRDIQGRIVLALSSITNNTAIDVSALTSGIYTVHVRRANGERAFAKWMKS